MIATPLPERVPVRQLALVALLLASASGCKVDRAAFEERLYSCNPTTADPACGTDHNDHPMACVPAYQLGGTNFCASGCDATADLEADPTGMCVPSGPRTSSPASGALLPRCNPGLLGSDCGKPELSCLRTDLIKDEGICTTVGSCKEDVDCRDPIRSKCMGVLLREAYNQATDVLKSDHTYCLQAECRARRTACSPGETCMRDILPKASNPPDICVPHCDANSNCPPNYFCYPRLYGPGAPRVCIPGLLGLRCESRLDCLFGDCVATSAPYKVCSVACQTDAECAKFDSVQATFFCNQQGMCMTERGFKGGACQVDTDCMYPGEICGHITTPYSPGFCMLACDPAGTCPSPGGVPHACRPQIDSAGSLSPAITPWVCWPGYFGQLCSDNTQCFSTLACTALNPANPALRICTIPCQTNAECDANHLTARGWCDARLGVCRTTVADGAACTDKRQCDSGSCSGPEGSKTCDPTPGY